MKILVYGAGNIGSLYAALLTESGHEVFMLARGRRLADIRAHGIRLKNVVTGAQTTVQANAVGELGTDDTYDLVLVALPKNHVSEVLPILAANGQTPSVMFFGNNARGPQEMIEGLGRDRVLLGFPGAAAVARGGCLHYLITSAQEQGDLMMETLWQLLDPGYDGRHETSPTAAVIVSCLEESTSHIPVGVDAIHTLKDW